MGIYDRDYYRNKSSTGMGVMSVWSVTTWLIVINVAVFLIDGAVARSNRGQDEFRQDRRHLGDFAAPRDDDEFAPPRRETSYVDRTPPLTRYGQFTIASAIFGGQIWRFVTFQFLHASIGHLFGNMIGLFLFGPIVEGHFGPRRYLVFYLLCGFAGAAMCTGLWAAGILNVSSATPMVGASAGIFGVLLAAARFAPDMQVNMYFFVPVPLRTLAWFMLAAAVYSVFTSGMNAGGEAAHIGGALLGLLLVQNQHWLNFVPSESNVTVTRAGRRRTQKDWSKDFNR